MLALTALVALAAEVLAVVHGKPITRADLEAALDDATRQQVQDARADLEDAEHSAARDYLGRIEAERAAKQQAEPADSIYARVVAGHFAELDPNLRNRIQQEREKLYEAEQAALERVVDQRLFEAAARARGQTPDELMHALRRRTPPVTKSDLDFIKAYENSKDQATASAPPGEDRLRAAIETARVEQLRQAVIDSVRRRAPVQTRLAAPRVDVSTANANVVGSPAAPVHIVVFTDFECPYCFEAEQTLAELRARYGDRVALYYLNYPLPSHPHARPAAEAAMCAAAQGKYAAFHDFLFAHSQDLEHADYAAWAQGLGLDRAAFQACESSGDAGKRVEDDIREGIAAGVNGTPTFVVNGRLVQDGHRLPEVVAQEVAAAKR